MFCHPIEKYYALEERGAYGLAPRPLRSRSAAPAVPLEDQNLPVDDEPAP